MVKSYKYLGITFNEKFNLDDHMIRIKRKLDFVLWRLSFVLKKGSLRLRRNLFKVYFDCIFRYMFPSYFYLKEYQKEKIRVVRRFYAKRVLGFKRNIDNNIVNLLIGDYDELCAKSMKRIEEKLRRKNIELEDFWVNRRLYDVDNKEKIDKLNYPHRS